jgi:hypothetical protein
MLIKSKKTPLITIKKKMKKMLIHSRLKIQSELKEIFWLLKINSWTYLVWMDKTQFSILRKTIRRSFFWMFRMVEIMKVCSHKSVPLRANWVITLNRILRVFLLTKLKLLTIVQIEILKCFRIDRYSLTRFQKIFILCLMKRKIHMMVYSRLEERN